MLYRRFCAVLHREHTFLIVVEPIVDLVHRVLSFYSLRPTHRCHSLSAPTINMVFCSFVGSYISQLLLTPEYVGKQIPDSTSFRIDCDYQRFGAVVLKQATSSYSAYCLMPRSLIRFFCATVLKRLVKQIAEFNC